MHLITERPAKLGIPVAERRNKGKSQVGGALTRHPPCSLINSTSNLSLEDTSEGCEGPIKIGI